MGLIGRLKASGVQVQQLLGDRLRFTLLGFGDRRLARAKAASEYTTSQRWAMP